MHNSQATIEKLYEVLEFNTCETLISSNDMSSRVFENIFIEEAHKKLGIDSVYFYRSTSQSTSIPYIYFQRLEGYNSETLAIRLSELHKLAWNMGEAPLLFVALPDGQVLIFNNYEPPTECISGEDYQTGLIEVINVFSASSAERGKISQYNRYNFESGLYWKENSFLFQIKKRADQTLLDNLKVMRDKLLELLPIDIEYGLASEIIHSLLGRSIFIKYLEDRRDSNNLNVFPEEFFEDYGSNCHCFTDVLRSKNETYKLFDYLDSKFNGDIFPVSDVERAYITDLHLEWLESFLLGNVDMKKHQLHLWKFYSFDAIPIEFISSIYEEFFHIQHETRSIRETTGTHYTPHFLVEFLVDEVFPWEGKKTTFSVLDPACGSGIFLVEIFRRIIAHWHQGNPDRQISFDELQYLLVENIYGVDLDAQAVRVAAFSLYLTLCDYLEPRQIWEKAKFYSLRRNNILIADFFDENLELRRSNYDLVIGNPPWKSELTYQSQLYQQRVKNTFPNRYIAPDKQIALAFLWRAAEFCHSDGEICFLMPSKGLLFNKSKPHRLFRNEFFDTYHTKLIINLSSFRHVLFEKGTGPASAIIYSPKEPNMDLPILYCSPKPSHSIEDRRQIIIEPHDIARLPRGLASKEPSIWKVAMWGGPRDLELVIKLTKGSFISLQQLSKNNNWAVGEGITIGKLKNRISDSTFLVGKPFIATQSLARFTMDESALPLFSELKIQTTRRPNKRIFDGPHVIIKQSPLAGEPGLRAALLLGPAVFKDSLLSISGFPDDIGLLAQCCIILNSRLFLYLALMTSGKWLVERDELQQQEILNFPMPSSLLQDLSFGYLKTLTNDEFWKEKVDRFIEQVYGLTDKEIMLINDALDYMLDYHRLGVNSSSLSSTYSINRDFLIDYATVLSDTMIHSFATPFQPVIFRGQSSIRVIGLRFFLDKNSSTNIVFEDSQQALDNALASIENQLLEQRSESVFIRRHVRVYTQNMIYIIKPDQKRFWTQSLALRDADEIYSEIIQAWGRD